MVSGQTALFGLLSGRARWLSQREAVLAQNVANADTPGYRPQDLKPADFDDLVRRGRGSGKPIGVARTATLHLAGTAARSLTGADEVDGFETAPDGNAVVLPEQLEKMSHTQLDYELTTNLYKRYLGLMRTALGTGQG